MRAHIFSSCSDVPINRNQSINRSVKPIFWWFPTDFATSGAILDYKTVKNITYSPCLVHLYSLYMSYQWTKIFSFIYARPYFVIERKIPHESNKAEIGPRVFVVQLLLVAVVTRRCGLA